MEKSRSNGPVGRWVLVKCPRFQPVVVLGKPRSFATFGGKNLRIRPIGGQAYPILDGTKIWGSGTGFYAGITAGKMADRARRICY